MNRSRNNKNPVLFCNGSGYDFHHLMQEIAKVTDEKIVPIANNSEQYITFSVGQLQFIDSLKFSLPGLAKMAENLRDEKKGQTKTPEQLAKCFPIMSKFISPHLLSLLTRKGIFPYQWLNSKTKFNETQLPSRKDFNSDLEGYNYCEHGCENKECEHEKIYTISQKDYDFAWIVWRETGCKTFGDYHDIYLKTDVLILADAFEAFRKASYSAFKLDPANYLTAPGLAWDACMKVTKVKLELFNEHQGDMHDFFTAMKRGGMSLARRRIARANIPGLEGYDRKKAKKWLLYLDANNLYGWAMSQYLPTGGFKWLSTKPLEATSLLVQKILSLKENSN